MSSSVFVYTMNRVGGVGAWSIYEFPFSIDAFTHRNGDLYIRSGDDVLRVVPGSLVDYGGDAREVFFDATIQWPYLDMGEPGVLKRMVGLDYVGVGVPTVSIGYNQASSAAFTVPFDIPADTVPGQIIHLPLMAPSLSVKIDFAGGQAWEFYALNLYLDDARRTA